MMKVRLFNPVVGLFLLLVAGIAMAFAVAANPSRTELGQVQTTPVSTTILPSITPVISPTLVVTTPAPPPVGTQYPSPVPSITFVRTPTIAPPQQTASVQAYITAMTEQYGQPIPDPNEAARRAEVSTYQSLYTRPGALIAQGTNTVLTGTLNLLTYRVEEVVLPNPVTFTRIIVGRTITVDRTWRFIITGGPFPISRAYPIRLLMDGKPVSTTSKEDTGQITFIVLDQTAIQEGARIAVGYFEGWEIAVLPERLHLLP